MLNDCRRGDAQTSVQNAQRHPAMAAICHCICILQLAFNDYRMESKILRRVRYVMNILPSFSPYPSSSLPLTKTGKKGTARDNEQKKSKIMVAGVSGPHPRGCQPPIPPGLAESRPRRNPAHSTTTSTRDRGEGSGWGRPKVSFHQPPSVSAGRLRCFPWLAFTLHARIENH